MTSFVLQHLLANISTGLQINGVAITQVQTYVLISEIHGPSGIDELSGGM